MSGLGFDAQSFIDQATGEPCEACGGEGTVSDEGLRDGYPHQVDCPACEGQGLTWPDVIVDTDTATCDNRRD